MIAAGNIAEIAQKLGASQGVVSAIKSAADRTGVDFGFLLEKAKTESSFDPNAKAKTSSATGLYQFIEKTWMQMVRDHGAQYGLDKYACQIDENCKVDDPKLKAEILNLRKDPSVAAYMAAEFTKSNEAQLDAKISGEVGKTELYLAHFMGAGAAGKFLQTYEKDPNAVAANFMPSEATANKSIFYDKSGRARTVGEIYQNFAQKFDDAAPVVSAPRVAAPSLPLAPALASAALELPFQSNIHISRPAANFNISPVANAPSDRAKDITDQILNAAGINPIRQQITQHNLSFLTQVALEAMHEATPGMMFDKAEKQKI